MCFLYLLRPFGVKPFDANVLLPVDNHVCYLKELKKFEKIGADLNSLICKLAMRFSLNLHRMSQLGLKSRFPDCQYIRFTAPQSNMPGLAAATLGCFLEIKNLSLHPRPSEAERVV